MSERDRIRDLIDAHYTAGVLAIENVPLSNEQVAQILANVNPHLFALKLISCGFDTLDTGRFHTFDQLTLLDLSGNKLTSLGSGLDDLKRLKELDLSRNELSALDFDHLRLDALEYLNLGHNTNLFITGSLPGTLIDLHLSGLGLEAIPDSVSGLAHLEALWLNDNAITGVPDWINDLKDLRTLDLSANKLTAFPTVLFENDSIEELMLDDNAIPTIPPEIASMRSLQAVYLERNGIEEVPAVPERIDVEI